MIHVLSIKAKGRQVLGLVFSDGSRGQFDLSDEIAAGGEMVEPLGDPAYFSRVFVEMGAPTWPNGYNLDPDTLHADMRREGLLESPAAAE